MEQAEILRQLLKEIEELLNRNITANGECQFKLLFGKTANDEDFIIEVLPDRIITQVFQENGWVRKNVYHPKEFISEELFEERWKGKEAKPKKHRSVER